MITRNAVFESLTADRTAERVDESRLASMARLGWRFEANLREASEPVEGPIFRSVDRLTVQSRDPDSPRFLRPAPGSHLVGDGPGGYVGALPPSVD